jgi:iron(III) transport system permease protein
VAIALPVCLIAGGIFADDPSHTWEHIRDTNLTRYILTSGGLLLGVLTLALVVGVGTAWLTATCSFPGSRFFRWSLALPLAIPTYVSAYAWTDLLDYSGPVQTALREQGISVSSYDWLPGSRSLPTAIMVIGLNLYPYIYLTLWPHFHQQSRRHIEAVRSLGYGPSNAFRRVILPASRTLLAAAGALVGLETLAEYGAVDHFGLDTFTTGIYRTWTGERSFAAASKLAALLLFGVTGLIVLERLSRASTPAPGPTPSTAQHSWQLRGWSAWAAVAACSAPFVLGFALPTARLLWLALLAWQHRSTPTELWQATGTSLVLAVSCAALITLLAFFLSYCRRLAPSRLAGAGLGIIRFGYAIPGSVLAVAILAPFAWVDNTWLTPGWLWLTGNEWRLPLTGTVLILFYAYVVRFSAIGLTAIDGRLQGLPRQLDESARSLGHGSWSILGRIHVPLIQRSILLGFLLVCLEILKELPATLMLQPWGIRTLAAALHKEVQQESLSGAAIPALVLIAAGLLAIWLTTRIHFSRKPTQ